MAQNALSVSQATCFSNSNAYSFAYGGHYYCLVKEAKTWTAAAFCASNFNGGYLVEINDQGEQTAIYNAIVSSGVAANYSPVGDGGGASYIWIGATDNIFEGKWYWDGNNDGITMYPQFWEGQGAAGANTGSVTNSQYNNWGGKSTSTIQEPDDFGSNQDHAAIALGAWPYGIAGEWNDIAGTNAIYYLIEYNALVAGFEQNSDSEITLEVYPNPSNDKIKIESDFEIKEIIISSVDGKMIITISSLQKEQTIDISNLNKGIYFLKITSVNNGVISKKIIKN